MKEGKIPCMDVDNTEELNWCIEELKKFGVFKVESIPYDKNARDRVAEPEFEFRVAFTDSHEAAINASSSKLMYIDFYFEPNYDETYDPVGEM